MLEIEAEVGRIPEKDEIEKDGECCPEWYEPLPCSESWETKSGAKVWKPVEALLTVFVRVFAIWPVEGISGVGAKMEICPPK